MKAFRRDGMTIIDYHAIDHTAGHRSQQGHIFDPLERKNLSSYQ